MMTGENITEITKLLRETREIALITQEKVSTLIAEHKETKHKVKRLEQFHWALQGVWAALLVYISYKDKIFF